jgi:NAD(P)-dependent dehydrogenase (short-subunit alcohol dehydrogenase family)
VASPVRKRSEAFASGPGKAAELHSAGQPRAAVPTWFGAASRKLCSDMRLKDKIALITGGTSGIGEATAILFAKEGAKVAITGRNEERGRAVTAQISRYGGEAIFIAADVSKAGDCRRSVDETLRAFGRIDILFNNAGIFYPNTVVDCTEEEWDLQLDINLKGAFLMSKFALPGMIERGSGVIIHNSSGWGIVGGDKAVAYCASKGGLVLLTKAMAIDHGRQGIRVNCICPGDVDTPMLPPDAEMRGLKWEDYLAGCSNRPMGRIGTSDEIANAVLFLACEDSSFMTGAALVVDGGGVAD